MTSINFGQLLQEHKGAGDPPPDGIYDTVCTKAEARTASTGKPMIVASFRVITGPEANKTIVNNFVLTADNPNAFWFFVRHMAVFGIDQATLAQVTDLQQIAPLLVDKQARLTIQKQPGRNLPNVTQVETVPGGALSAAPNPGIPTTPSVQTAAAPPAPEVAVPQAPQVPIPQDVPQAPPQQPVYQAPQPQYQAPPAAAPAPPQAPVPQAPAPQPAPAQAQPEVPQPPQVPF